MDLADVRRHEEPCRQNALSWDSVEARRTGVAASRGISLPVSLLLYHAVRMILAEGTHGVTDDHGVLDGAY